MLPVLVKCDACEAQSTITNYTFVCAHCGAPTKNIIQGTELLIHQVTFAQEPLHPTT
jgi:hydrogenase nickel incorporation protein HypA/HybF